MIFGFDLNQRKQAFTN